MSNILTLNALLLHWITKPQSSTGLNWGSEAMLFYLCLLLLDRCSGFKLLCLFLRSSCLREDATGRQIGVCRSVFEFAQCKASLWRGRWHLRSKWRRERKQEQERRFHYLSLSLRCRSDSSLVRGSQGRHEQRSILFATGGAVYEICVQRINPVLDRANLPAIPADNRQKPADIRTLSENSWRAFH